MIVYGDPSEPAGLHELATALAARATSLAEPVGCEVDALEHLSGLRDLLIGVGCLEQAGVDHLAGPGSDGAVGALQGATDSVAEAFHRCWAQTQRIGVNAPVDGEVSAGMARARNALARVIREVADATLTVKTPEGFAFYTLYPEQYGVAAHLWADDHAADAPGPVAVVGVRSIGTTQSAVVAAALRTRGWRTSRVTVRPGGHPFERTVDVPAEIVAEATWALVVDEGPGISGSSMAAVADALERAGMDAARIGFLPGHGGEPGPMASDAVRARWGATPRYAVPLASLRWEGRSLTEVLAAATASGCGNPAAPVHVDDVGAGAWRAFTFDDPSAWPPARPRFERAKYRARLDDGRAVLWKFFGCDAAAAAELVATRSAIGWGPELIAVRHGFVATAWVQGAPSRPADAPACLADLARYVADVAGPPLEGPELAASVSRLAEMLVANAAEALGPKAAQRATRWADAATRTAARLVVASAGDAAMEPAAWLRDETGRLWKVGGIGHDRDHTMIGRQPVAWDVAGTIVEWELDVTSRATFVQAVAARGHHELLDAAWLRFHELAYAAFRLGYVALGAAPAGDPAEAARVATTIERSRARLAELLDGS